MLSKGPSRRWFCLPANKRVHQLGKKFYPPRLVLLIYEASYLLPKRLSLVFDSLE